MTTKPVFTDTVTTIPGDWANAVSDLVYDVFGLATTIDAVRTAIGLGTIFSQNANAINITGGQVNGVDIGSVNPATGRFTRIEVTNLGVNAANQLVPKQYVDAAILSAIDALNLQNMSQQRNNNVAITGGVAIYDRLRSRAIPTLNEDVITLKHYNDKTQKIQQTLVPMTVNGDNRRVTTPFPTKAGAMVIFVDQLYQIPDQYEITGANEIRFLVALPANAVVGGFCLWSAS